MVFPPIKTLTFFLPVSSLFLGGVIPVLFNPALLYSQSAKIKSNNLLIFLNVVLRQS